MRALLVLGALAASAAGVTPAPVTVHLKNVPCTLSVAHPAFKGTVLKYSGNVRCTGAPRSKTLKICAQVLHGSSWFTIKGSCVTKGPSHAASVALTNSRTVVRGHEYRIYGIAHAEPSSVAWAYTGGGSP